MGRAQENKLAEIKIHDLRKWGIGERRTVDDRPYGGGVGMILRVDVIEKAIQDLRFKNKENEKVILLTPQGKKFHQLIAREYSRLEHIILICGRYEGFDERIAENLVDEELSIGDYVLTGGELPAMVVTDTVIRLIPGVIPKEEATAEESFSEANLVEYPQYTRPPEYNSWKVPEILLTGDHQKIEDWRRSESIKKTLKNRPDLT